MRLSLFAFVMFFLFASDLWAAPCEQDAKSIVSSVSKTNFNTPKGYFPVIRAVKQTERTDELGSCEFLIDMENSAGQILNGGSGGSSAFEVQVDYNAPSNKLESCFITQIKFTDEPEDSLH